MSEFDLGSIPTWLAGVGTVGTLSAALVQIRGERKRRLSQEIAAAKSLKESQAQLIAVFDSSSSLNKPSVPPFARVARNLRNLSTPHFWLYIQIALRYCYEAAISVRGKIGRAWSGVLTSEALVTSFERTA